MLFQEHYSTYAEYIQRSIMVDDFINNKLDGTDLCNGSTTELLNGADRELPVSTFLETLDDDVLRMMTTIQCIGLQTDDVLEWQGDALSTYQHYYINGEFQHTREDYISYLLCSSWEWGTGYTFIRGLEVLDIELKGIPCAVDITDDDYSDYIKEFNTVDYIKYRELLRTRPKMFDDEISNDMAIEALQPCAIALNGVVRLRIIDYINIWNGLWFNTFEFEISITDVDDMQYFQDIYVEYIFNKTKNADAALSDIIADRKMDIANVHTHLKRLEMEYELKINVDGEPDYICDTVLSDYSDSIVCYVSTERKKHLLRLISQNHTLDNVLVLKVHIQNIVFIIVEQDISNRDILLYLRSLKVQERLRKKYPSVRQYENQILKQLYYDYYGEHD